MARRTVLRVDNRLHLTLPVIRKTRGPHNDCALVTTEQQRGFIFDLGLRECHVFPLTHTRLPKLKASLKNL